MSPVLGALVGLGFSAASAAEQRCDLVSRTACMDLSRLNGATIRVPSVTTRITPEGLNICGVSGSVPPPTDIVYIVDQTGSMSPTFIQVKGTDTTAWNSCNYSQNAPTLKMVGTTVFHGTVSSLISPAEPLDSIRASCAVAGDPYSMRSKVVQAAIRTQASEAHQSSAGTINFGPTLLSTQESMTRMTDPIGVTKLLASMPLDSVGGTNYEPALAWARILLYGGHSGASWVPASPNWKKAIVMISDGQPTEGNWRNALGPAVKVLENGKTWTNDAPTIPPVFAIFLGVNQLNGSVLDTLAHVTGGAYYQIPPNKPDSLEQVLRSILGQIIHEGSPQSLTITNRTNGQVSRSISVESDGASNQMPLDSLVALERGTNSLELVVQQTSIVQRANLTVVVSDSAPQKTLLDSVLALRCGDVSKLTVKPDNSGLAWADAPDRNLQMSLSTASINYMSVPLGIATRVSRDTELVVAPLLDLHADSARRAFGTQIPWRNLVAGRAVAFDNVVRSASGWDSARVVFRMPRDRRDTAVAYIALHRPPSSGLWMTESVDGPAGTIEAEVVDSGSATSTVTISVKSASGDAMSVVLSRGTDDVYRGSFSFRQDAAPVAGDTLLQTGRGTPRLDSIEGTYLAQAARTAIHLPAPRFRFVGPDGSPRDSLGLDLPIGGVARVVVQAYVGDSPCLSCGERVSVLPSARGIGIRPLPGADSLRLRQGRLEIEVVGLSPVAAGSIGWRGDSTGARIVADPVAVELGVPDSVVYLDVDGDGTFDRAVVHARGTQRPGFDLRLPWPDPSSRVGAALDRPSFSTDSTAVWVSILTSVPRTTGSTGPLLAKWRSDADGNWTDVKVVDRIAPVPLRARLRRGVRFDTLRVTPSEPLVATGVAADAVDQLVSRWRAAGVFQAVAPRSARVDSATGELLLVFPADSTDDQVRVGDSVRFAAGGFARDSGGNAAGPVARQVVVEGSDPLPLSATLFDTDADGRADRVVIRLRRPLAVTESVGFRWPDTSGGFQTRLLLVTAARTDSGGRILTFDIEPFAFGATSCPVAGCGDLAWFASTRFGSSSTLAFPLRDGVDPIILDARLGYGSEDGVPDSLSLVFSEPLSSSGGRPWIAWGRPGTDSLGQAVASRGNPMLVGGDRGLIATTASFLAAPGDSVRIFAAPRGGLTDQDFNAPETLAHWTPIRFPELPIRMEVEVATPLLVDRGQILSPLEPPVSVLVRKDGRAPWNPLPGGIPLARPLDDYASVLVTLNRIPDDGGLFIYDRLGVAVTHLDFRAVRQAADAGLLERTRRGDYQILFAWNGCDAAGRKVATGIYLARVYGWIADDHRSGAVNVVRTIGVRRPLPSNN